MKEVLQSKEAGQTALERRCISTRIAGIPHMELHGIIHTHPFTLSADASWNMQVATTRWYGRGGGVLFPGHSGLTIGAGSSSVVDGCCAAARRGAERQRERGYLPAAKPIDGQKDGQGSRQSPLRDLPVG